MPRTRFSLAGAVVGAWLAASMLLGACERPKAPVNGLGGFELAKTTLASVQSEVLNCLDSETTTRCWVNPRHTILGRVPDMELHFAGKTPDSVLAEIRMRVPGCQLDELETWLEDKLGKPTEDGDKHAIWAQKYIFLRVDLTGPSRCVVTAVSPVDTERVAQLKG